MKFTLFSRQLITGVIVASTLSSPCFGAVNETTIQQLTNQVSEYQTNVEELKNEYDKARNKREKMEKKLRQSELELRRKKAKLVAKQSEGAQSEQAQNAIINEQKRLELLELGISSQIAAIERAQEKEQSLAEEIATSEKRHSDAKAKLSASETSYRKQLRREISSLSNQVRSLREQNQHLELALEEATIKAESARAEARSMAEQNAELLALAEAQQETISAQQAPINGESQEQLDISQMVLPGELPIYQEANDSDIILRSRTLDEKYPMREISKNVYEAEVEIAPNTNRAYFDVIKRRYRGKFPDHDKVVTYVFTLDKTDPEQPTMDLRVKGGGQVVSNNEAPL